MMHISRWKALGILLTALLVSMLAVPSFFSEKTVQKHVQGILGKLGVSNRKEAASHATTRSLLET